MNKYTLSGVEIATAPEMSESGNIEASFVQPIKLDSYEHRRWLYILTLPISWLLTLYVIAKKLVYKKFGIDRPQTNTMWFDGLGPGNRQIKDGAASWKALDIIYNHNFSFGWRKIIDNFWIGMMNAQAVRNRYKLVRQEVRRAILRFSGHGEVRLISLACGSAQAVIEIIAEFKHRGVIVKAILVDIDKDALEYARNLAKCYGVCSQIEIKQISVAAVAMVAVDFKPQIIEMLGLLDYIEQGKAIRLSEKIRESLEPDGVYLTCNIAPNPEQHFLHWVINWPMIYRDPSDLVEIAEKAGFKDYRIIYEPLRIHGILIAEK
ncbi:MAG: class I SAM-dependent methyltransferase family protein [Candidatus Buchananbacteria bacterium]|jgi:SAM-dependent methyltransferase